MIPWAVAEALLCPWSDPTPGHGQTHEHSWEPAAAALSPRAFPCSGDLHSRTDGRDPTWARLRLAPAPCVWQGWRSPSLCPSRWCNQELCPVAVESGRGSYRGEAATGAGQRSRTAPWCSGTAGSECPQPQHGHEVGCNPKNPQNPQVAASSRCGGMSRSTRGQTKSFRSDPHLPRAEIHSFEVS